MGSRKPRSNPNPNPNPNPHRKVWEAESAARRREAETQLLKVSDAHSEDVHKAAQAVRLALEARWRRLMPNLSSLEGISTAEETVIIQY